MVDGKCLMDDVGWIMFEFGWMMVDGKDYDFIN